MRRLHPPRSPISFAVIVLGNLRLLRVLGVEVSALKVLSNLMILPVPMLNLMILPVLPVPMLSSQVLA